MASFSSSSSGTQHQRNDDTSNISSGEDSLNEIISRVVADCHNRKWNRDVDVFINFLSEDTGANFISILHRALCGQYVNACIDKGIERGVKVLPLNKIERSLISIVVFSKNYASAQSSMLELNKILKCRAMNGQIVIPVFHRVQPSDVRGLTDILGDGFVKHLQDSTVDSEAMRETSYLAGWVSTNIGSDAKLIEKIVKDILKKLVLISILMADNLVSFFDMARDKLDSCTDAFWNNTDLRQLHCRIKDVRDILQKARRYKFNQHLLIRRWFQNLRSRAYAIGELLDDYEKSEISIRKFDREVKRIDEELVQFSNLFQNLVTSHNGERSAITKCLSWESPSSLSFINSPSSSPITNNKDSYNLSGRHVAQSLPLATSSHTLTVGGTAGDDNSLFLSCRSSRTTKTVLELDINDEEVRHKAFIVVSQFVGISHILFDETGKKMTIIGDVNAVTVATELGKLCSTKLLTFGEANELDDKEEEQNEGERNRKEPKQTDKKKKDVAGTPKDKSRKSSSSLFSCFYHK